MNRIPKYIHYCWFGKGKIPKSNTRYINRWKKVFNDYEIILWNEDNFPFASAKSEYVPVIVAALSL